MKFAILGLTIVLIVVVARESPESRAERSKEAKVAARGSKNLPEAAVCEAPPPTPTATPGQG